jgi:hypothetical protein
LLAETTAPRVRYRPAGIGRGSGASQAAQRGAATFGNSRAVEQSKKTMASYCLRLGAGIRAQVEAIKALEAKLEKHELEHYNKLTLLSKTDFDGVRMEPSYN